MLLKGHGTYSVKVPSSLFLSKIFKPPKGSFSSPPLQVITKLLSVCVRCDDPERAVSLWKEIEGEHGVSPLATDSLARTCVHVVTSTGDAAMAQSILKDLRTYDLSNSSSSSLPSWMGSLWCSKLMHALVEAELLTDAIKTFEWLRELGLPVESPHTFATLLTGCAEHGSLAQGRKLHQRIKEIQQQQQQHQQHQHQQHQHQHSQQHNSISEREKVLAASLINMYGRCGLPDEAKAVFYNLSLSDKISHLPAWTAVINAYGLSGRGSDAVQFFEEMVTMGAQPNALSLCCLLNACSQSGLVERAWSLLMDMPTKYGLQPSILHFNCVVDALCRASQFDAAEKLMEDMQLEGVPPDFATYTAILGACRWHGDVNRAKRLLKKASAIAKGNANQMAVLKVLEFSILGAAGCGRNRVLS